MKNKILAFAGLTATTAIVTTMLLTAKDVTEIPGAKVTDRVQEEAQGDLAVGIVINNLNLSRQLNKLFTMGTTSIMLKNGQSQVIGAIKYKGVENIRLFYAVREADYPTFIANFPFNYSGGLVFNPDDTHDMEARLADYMTQQGVSSYEILSL